MNVTTLEQADSGDENNSVPVRLLPPVPRQDQVTAIQIGTLLHATAMISSLLIRTTDEDDDGTLTPKKSEAHIAAENSIIKILDRLDSIIVDNDRWNLTGQRLLESELSAVYKSHLALLTEQRAGIAAVNAPHRHAGIKLARLDGGLWAAILGTPGSGDCIVGIGGCAAEACADFDRQFNGNEKQNDQTKSEQPVDTNTSKLPDGGPSEPEQLDGNRGILGADGQGLPAEI